MTCPAVAMRPTPGSRNRGFTLIELLVVIAIIAVLIGVLLVQADALATIAKSL